MTVPTETRIILLRSAPVAGVMRTKGWAGPVPAAVAADLIARGWAVPADRTKGKDDAAPIARKR